MKVLIGFEHTGIVCNAFRMAGHEAYSNDLKPGNIPNWHIQGDFFEVFDRYKPDLCITHHPCTYLARGAQNIAHWPGRAEEAQKSIEQTKKIWALPVSKLAMENPIGILSTKWQRPTQIIFPWQFGDNYSKDIALWLRGLPQLTPEVQEKPGKLQKVSNHVNSRMSTEQRREVKSRFFPGVARAMAETWGQAGDNRQTNQGQPGEDRQTNQGHPGEDRGTKGGGNTPYIWW